MSEQRRSAGFATLALHAGASADQWSEASPRLAESAEAVGGREASLVGVWESLLARRYGGEAPATTVLEERIAALEGGTAAVAAASGQTARLVALQVLLRPGDEIVASRALPPDAIGQFERAFESFGWTVSYGADESADSIAAVLSPRTRAIIVPSIASPGGRVIDIAAVAAVARQAHVPLIVDNTLATPFLVQPLDHGADVIIHSTMRFLAGQPQATGGVIVDGGTFDWLKDDRYPALSTPNASHGGLIFGQAFGNFAFCEACRVFGLRHLGPPLSPLAAFLVLSGLETLALRMQRQCDSALAIADHLVRHPAIYWVTYAGLPSDPGHALGRRLAARGAGSAFSFGVAGGYDAGAHLVRKLRLFMPLCELGDTRSLAVHPPSAGKASGAWAYGAGARDEAVILSVGLEDSEDLIADLDQALAV